MSADTESFTGGCLCRKCTYTISGPIEPAGICHCADCRKVTGSPYGVSFRVLKNRFSLSGNPAAHAKSADSGTVLTRYFCPNCGSPLFTASEENLDAIFVKAGTLDQPEHVQIERQAWVSSRVSWAAIPTGIATYQKGR
jgi:hypothetical protein